MCFSGNSAGEHRGVLCELCVFIFLLFKCNQIISHHQILIPRLLQGVDGILRRADQGLAVNIEAGIEDDARAGQVFYFLQQLPVAGPGGAE